MVKTITTYIHDCGQCLRSWRTQLKQPIRCGKCQSPYWNRIRLCASCQTELTSADREARACTQCREPLPDLKSLRD